MRVLVCGSRDWQDAAAIHNALERLRPAAVITGGCRGADSIAANWARAHEVQLLEMPADWRAFGRAAGPIRNRQMIEQGKPDLVLAFHANIETSRGTRDMVKQAQAAGVRVQIVTGEVLFNHA
jgi:hypothetical protein